MPRQKNWTRIANDWKALSPVLYIGVRSIYWFLLVLGKKFRLGSDGVWTKFLISSESELLKLSFVCSMDCLSERGARKELTQYRNLDSGDERNQIKFFLKRKNVRLKRNALTIWKFRIWKLMIELFAWWMYPAYCFRFAFPWSVCWTWSKRLRLRVDKCGLRCAEWKPSTWRL